MHGTGSPGMEGPNRGGRTSSARNAGSSVDWWTVKTALPGELVLATRDWKIGEGWLGYRLSEDGVLEQAAAFRPKGVPGFLYWKLLRPFHAAAFSAMLRARANPRPDHTRMAD